MTIIETAAHDDLIYYRGSHPDALDLDETYFRSCYDLGSIDEPWPDYWSEVQRQHAADPPLTPEQRVDQWLRLKNARELWQIQEPASAADVGLYSVGRGLVGVIRYRTGGVDVLVALNNRGTAATLDEAAQRLGVR